MTPSALLREIAPESIGALMLSASHAGAFDQTLKASMNWHYAINGENRGPVDNDEFRRLVDTGVITRETLIWSDGMSNWAPYSEKFPGLPSSLATAGQEHVSCAMCRRSISRNDAFVLSGVSYCATCKPLLLQGMREGVGVGNSAAEETRKQHIKHEASVKSIGVLYFLGGALLLLGGLAMVAAAFSSEAKAETLGMAIFCLVLAPLQIVTGVGLRRFRPWARVISGILSGIGLLGFPLGTLINGYILYLLFSKKGATVFSPEYQEVIRQTPHIKYKSWLGWVLLGVVVLIIVAVIVAAAVSGHR